MSDAHSAALARALALSQQVLAAAEHTNLEALAHLDAERLRLLQSVRAERHSLSVADQRMLAEVAALNDRAIGIVEHHRRIKERAIDLAAMGRRAVAAYSMTGPRR